MFKHQDLQMVNWSQINFHPLEVAGRVSKPQLQVGAFLFVYSLHVSLDRHHDK